MTLNEYQNLAKETAIYPCVGFPYVYPLIGLAGETGELEEKFKKIIRDKHGLIQTQDYIEIQKELGDILWYLAMIAKELNMNLDDVAYTNILKLQDRKERDVLHGSGDERQFMNIYTFCKDCLYFNFCVNGLIVLDPYDIKCSNFRSFEDIEHMSKNRVMIDFDGVIHAYSKGWQDGSIYDKPIDGCKEALDNLKSLGYHICIFTARLINDSEAERYIETWLHKYNIPFDEITSIKLPALLYIDDRGYRFSGNWNQQITTINRILQECKPSSSNKQERLI